MGEREPREQSPEGCRVSEAVRKSLLLSQRAAQLARQAADCAAEMAARQQRIARLSGTPETAARTAAEAQRRSVACQRAAARLHANYARRLLQWLARQDPSGGRRPVFMSAVASTAGWQGAVLTLMAERGVEGLVAASGPAARATHELEVSFAEGPASDALRTRCVVLAGSADLEDRWPRFGPAVRTLGIGAVAATPVDLGSGGCGGSLTVVGRRPPADDSCVAGLGEVAGALSAVLTVGSAVDGHVDVPRTAGCLDLFEPEDFQPELHAAAGLLHERCGYAMADALALVRAHAFAEGRPLKDIALDVIRTGVLAP